MHEPAAYAIRCRYGQQTGAVFDYYCWELGHSIKLLTTICLKFIRRYNLQLKYVIRPATTLLTVARCWGNSFFVETRPIGWCVRALSTQRKGLKSLKLRHGDQWAFGLGQSFTKITNEAFDRWAISLERKTKSSFFFLAFLQFHFPMTHDAVLRPK